MNREITVLAFVPGVYGISPGQRYRIEQWEPILREKGINITYRPFESEDLRRLIYKRGNIAGKMAEVSRAFVRRFSDVREVGKFDLVYLFREAALLGPAFFERLVAQWGTPYVFDFDDAVFLSYKSPANGYLSYLKFPGKTRAICRNAAHVMAGNEYLADYARAVNQNVTIVPSTIDTDLYIPDYPREQPETITIVWSGSFSTLQHLDTIRGALQRLAKERRFRLRVIGATEYSPEGVDTESVQWRAATEVEDLKPGHIGIMPLPNDQWSKGKCGLKALQYMALGIPAICSPVGVNSTIIDDGRNGFLADSEDEWIEKLKMLMDSVELRIKMGAEGRVTVEEEYSARCQAPRVAEVFASVASGALIR